MSESIADELGWLSEPLHSAINVGTESQKNQQLLLQFPPILPNFSTNTNVASGENFSMEDLQHEGAFKSEPDDLDSQHPVAEGIAGQLRHRTRLFLHCSRLYQYAGIDRSADERSS